MASQLNMRRLRIFIGTLSDAHLKQTSPDVLVDEFLNLSNDVVEELDNKMIYTPPRSAVRKPYDRDDFESPSAFRTPLRSNTSSREESRGCHSAP